MLFRSAEALRKWGQGPSALIVLGSEEVGALKSFRNIERVTVLSADAVGVADVVGSRSLVISKTALETLTKRAADS